MRYKKTKGRSEEVREREKEEIRDKRRRLGGGKESTKEAWGGVGSIQGFR